MTIEKALEDIGIAKQLILSRERFLKRQRESCKHELVIMQQINVTIGENKTKLMVLQCKLCKSQFRQSEGENMIDTTTYLSELGLWKEWKT